MIGKIHIKPQSESHLDYGFHGVDGKNLKLARTVFGFMIKSVFGDYKEMVRLVPKFSSTSEDLFHLTNNVLKMLKELGAQVKAIITDNNRINIKLFDQLIEHPNSLVRLELNNPIFFLFDPVHIIKNIRNNLFNKQEIHFCTRNIDNKVIHRIAKLEHLYNLFKETEENPIKLSCTLTLSSNFYGETENTFSS